MLKTLNWTKENLAWAAGLFEGEGCFSIYSPSGSRHSHQITAALSSTDFDVVEKFQKIIGMGIVRGDYNKNKPNIKPFRSWRANRFEIVQQLGILFWPWLCERRKKKFIDIMKFWKTRIFAKNSSSIRLAWSKKGA